MATHITTKNGKHSDAGINKKPIHMRLMELDEEEIQALNAYELLGLDEPVRATPYTIKRAYRKSSILYHPDKTGRDDNDYVFIAVKSAWDTLSDPALRKAYDSTEMPFDDSIPPDASVHGVNGLLYTDADFYSLFGPVFERNLRFDTRLQEQTSKKGSNEIPSLGDEDTPIEAVQAFYDYWVQFDSWRDFSQKAQEELFENNNPLEDAESRYEKRYYEKEIAKKAKALKRQEISRIQTLVQRAMTADPRLQRHYKQQKENKEKAALERKLALKQEERNQKEAAAKHQKEQAEVLEQEREQRALEKMQREKEKKQLRKAKQQLRKITIAVFQEQEEVSDELPFSSLEEMSEEVEYLCGELDLMQIQNMTDHFSTSKDFTMICGRAHERRRVQDQEREAKKIAAAKIQRDQEEEARLKSEELARSKAWSQQELTALTKAVKKFPGGGGNRWEQIASYINNNCRPDEPRLREECIEKFNQITKASAAAASAAYDAAGEAAPEPDVKEASENGSSPLDQSFRPKMTSKDPAIKSNTDGVSQDRSPTNNPKARLKSDNVSIIASALSAKVEADVWTDSQDKLLQEGLSKFSSSLNKNDRWTLIAKMVDGKSKKQCVQRFKAIRDAIKAKK